MDGGAWWAAVHGVAQGQTRLSDLAAAAAPLCMSGLTIRVSEKIFPGRG